MDKKKILAKILERKIFNVKKMLHLPSVVVISRAGKEKTINR